MAYSYTATTRSGTAIYASPNTDQQQIDSISSGINVSVETCGVQNFFKTNYGSTGYILAKQVYIMNGRTTAVIQGASASDYSNLRELPKQDATRLAKLYPGDDVVVLHETSNGYSRVSTTSGTGWVLTNSLYYG